MNAVQGLEGYKLKEVRNIILSHIDLLRESFHFEDLNFSIQDIILFGSRVTGLPKMNSDLDVKIKYIGDAREDDLFNALNDKREGLRIEGIIIDFFPENISTTFSASLDQRNQISC